MARYPATLALALGLIAVARWRVPSAAADTVEASCPAGDAACASLDEDSSLLQTVRVGKQQAVRTDEKVQEGEKRRCLPPVVLANDNVQNVLPLPPAWYPSQLQGMLWLDQLGSWGNTSTLLGTFDDLIISFGGIRRPLNPATRTLDIDVNGPSWQWFSSEDAFLTFGIAWLADFYYEFQFNQDYSEALIHPTVTLLGFKLQLPTFLVKFTMILQTPPSNCSTLGPDATTDQIKACALWRRESFILGANAGTYYVHQVVDKDRKPLEPQYSQYLKFANSVSSDEAEVLEAFHAAETIGLTLTNPNNLTVNSSFVGTDCANAGQQTVNETITLKNLVHLLDLF